MTTGRDELDFRSRWAVNADDVMRHLNELQPTVVHFSGHGTRSVSDPAEDTRARAAGVDGTALTDESSGPGLDVKSPSAALLLQDEHRVPQEVSARALAQMIRTAAPSARVVVLNACHTEAVANELRDSVQCVVAMRGAIEDESARAFAVAFYRALGHRCSVGNAVAQAVTILTARRLPGDHLPVCVTPDGVDPEAVVLSSS
jgi:CHAT domain-containing protein